MSPRELELREWQRARAGPGGHAALEGLFLGELGGALERAPFGGRLRVSECRHGLVVEARQHVGVVQLGPLRVRVRPKLKTTQLWHAVAYALGLDGLHDYDPVALEVEGDFADLLALMLVCESERVWRAGTQRGYRAVNEWRSTLRGRPDLAALARNGPLTEPALPCRYQAFTADVLENQVVLAGLDLARTLSSGLKVRGALHRAIQQWSTICQLRRLDGRLLDEAERTRTRLNSRYAGAHRLVRLLYDHAGVDDGGPSGRDSAAGFLWDMARLFEAFVARYLSENLPEHEVVTQHRLRGLYRVVHDRPGRRAPSPRPDLVLREHGGRVLAVLDTKYKDLWHDKLPREILYQMSVYSLAWGDAGSGDLPAVVLYPTPGGDKPDIEYELVVRGGRARRIVVRAIDWSAAVAILKSGDPGLARQQAQTWVGI